MANTHQEDPDLARGKESSDWALKLTKELRNNMVLASTYLLEPPTRRKSLKLSLHFFLFLEFQGAPPPSKQWLVGWRKEIVRFYRVFLGMGGEPNHPYKCVPFFGAGGGWPAPTNEVIRGGSPPPTPINDVHFVEVIGDDPPL